MGILQEFLFVPWLKLLWVVCATGRWHHHHHLRSLNSSPSCPGWAAICKRQHAFFKFQSILIQILAKLPVLFVVSFFHIWISCNRNWDQNHKSRISWHFHDHPFVFLGCNVGRVIDTNIVLEISKNLSRNFVKNLLRDFVNKFVSTNLLIVGENVVCLCGHLRWEEALFLSLFTLWLLPQFCFTV